MKTSLEKNSSAMPFGGEALLAFNSVVSSNSFLNMT